MQKRCDDFLARPTLTLDQDRHVIALDLFQVLPDHLHHRRSAKDYRLGRQNRASGSDRRIAQRRGLVGQTRQHRVTHRRPSLLGEAIEPVRSRLLLDNIPTGGLEETTKLAENFLTYDLNSTALACDQHEAASSADCHSL